MSELLLFRKSSIQHTVQNLRLGLTADDLQAVTERFGVLFVGSLHNLLSKQPLICDAIRRQGRHGNKDGSCNLCFHKFIRQREGFNIMATNKPRSPRS